MKYIALMSLIFLTACESIDGTDQTYDMITFCLDGVSYWVDGEGSQYQMMAPRIDPKTLTFVRCEGKTK